MAVEVEEREAAHGEKMIEVKVRFWTDDLAPTDGHVLPKHAWTAGVVRLKMEIGAVIEQALIDHGVELHASQRMRKYVSE